eukprot:scaffold44483_cov191-Amphora_coffeaeformis.AAC.2
MGRGAFVVFHDAVVVVVVVVVVAVVSGANSCRYRSMGSPSKNGNTLRAMASIPPVMRLCCLYAATSCTCEANASMLGRVRLS